MIEVYSKSNCVQCDMTMKLLEKQGISYVVFDVEKQQEAADYVKKLGYMQAPVVVNKETGQHWSGFHPEKIKGIIC